MNLYALLCRYLPRLMVNWGFVIARAILIILIILYSNNHFGHFAYLKT